MRRTRSIGATAEQSSFDQIGGDALDFAMKARGFARAVRAQIRAGPVLDECGQRTDSGATKAEIAILFRIQEYNPLVRAACVYMLRKVVPLVAHDRAPGVRLNTGHRGYARTQGRGYRNTAGEPRPAETGFMSR